MKAIIFQDLPEKYSMCIREIKNEWLQEIYAKFPILYIDYSLYQDEAFKTIFLKFINNYKFITYNTMRSEEEDKNISIICTEEKFVIFESINESYLKQIFSESTSTIIKADEGAIKSESYEDFTRQFQEEIERNEFIELTIYPIAFYLIQRYKYPKIYFKNPSFFKFDKNDSFEGEIAKEEVKTKLDEISKLNFNKDANQQRKIFEFKNNDFILLKVLHVTDSSDIHLVLHKKSLFLFVKKVSNGSIYKEECFCEKCTNEYFARFYGFIKENNRIVGFVYEYMNNESYQQFIQNNQGKFNELYSFLSMIRISNGINYLQSNSYVHRDLKPSNILVDHDFNVYISDFETITSIDNDEEGEKSNEENFTTFADGLNQSPEFHNNQRATYELDIYSFGLIVYFIFENKQLIKNSEDLDKLISEKYKKLPKMINGSNRMKSLFYSTVKFESKERITIKEIQNLIKEEMKSFFYLDKYFLNDMNDELLTITIQYIYEHIKLLKLNNDSSEIEEFLNHLYDLFLIRLISKETNFFTFLFNYSPDTNSIKFSNNFNKVLKNIVSNEYTLMNGRGNPSQISFFKESNQDVFRSFLIVCIQLFYHPEISINEFFKEEKNSRILNFLGNVYFEGNEIEKDYSIAREFFERSGAEGDSESLLKLGDIYLYGYGVDKDIDIALFYYEESANKENQRALIQLGDFYFKGNIIEKDVELALTYYERLGNLGNSDALLFLGNIYYKGNGVPRNDEKAYEYYLKASKLNNSEAKFFLGEMNLYGEGRKVDKYLAKDYYEKSASQNNSFSLFQLGNLNIDDKYFDKDLSKAKSFFKKSMEQNNSFATQTLGTISLLGLDGEQNFKEGIEYLEKAADLNNHIALLHLGNIYFNGAGVEKNFEKALEYYKRAELLNDPDAPLILGDIYSNGNEACVKISIQYYLKCIQNYQNKKELFKNKLVSQQITNHYNYNYYRANNNIGLIYLLFYNDIELAKKYLKISASLFNQGRINYSLLLYLFDGNKDFAVEYLQKPIGDHISFAEFIFGFINEREGKLDESIKYYIRASNHANVQIFLFGLYVYDEKYEYSKMFILCLTNLKLSHYFLLQKETKENINEAKKYFVRAFFKLMLYEQKSPNKFSYNNNDDVFSNLNDFLFNYPKFNLKSQFNLDLLNKNFPQIKTPKILNIQETQNDNKNEKEIEIIEKIDLSRNKKDDDIDDEKVKKLNLLKDKPISKNKDDSDDEDVVDNYEETFLFELDIYHYFDKNIQEKIQIMKNQSIEESRRVKRYIESLFKFIIKNNSKQTIAQNIDLIIQKMSAILYDHPYSILFGRIKNQ